MTQPGGFCNNNRKWTKHTSVLLILLVWVKLPKLDLYHSQDYSEIYIIISVCLHGWLQSCAFAWGVLELSSWKLLLSRFLSSSYRIYCVEIHLLQDTFGRRDVWDSILKKVGTENSFSRATGNQLSLLLVQSESSNLWLKRLLWEEVTTHPADS